MKRVLAITLGTILGLLAVLSCRAALRPEPVPNSMTVHGARLEIVDAPPACPRSGTELLVTSSAPGDWREPRLRSDADAGGRIANAEWGGWAEQRCLTLAFDEKGGSARASIAFDTDYGLYLGTVDPVRSSAHRHGSVLCFDLSVDRLDGSGFRERWRGEVPFP